MGNTGVQDKSDGVEIYNCAYSFTFTPNTEDELSVVFLDNDISFEYFGFNNFPHHPGPANDQLGILGPFSPRPDWVNLVDFDDETFPPSLISYLTSGAEGNPHIGHKVDKLLSLENGVYCITGYVQMAGTVSNITNDKVVYFEFRQLKNIDFENDQWQGTMPFLTIPGEINSHSSIPIPAQTLFFYVNDGSIYNVGEGISISSLSNLPFYMVIYKLFNEEEYGPISGTLSLEITKLSSELPSNLFYLDMSQFQGN